MSSSSPFKAKSIFSLETSHELVTMASSNSTPSSTPALPPRSPLNVNEEYDRAFRSKSFIDLWSHARHHLKHTFSSVRLSSMPKHYVQEPEEHQEHNDQENQELKQEEYQEDMEAMHQSCSSTILDNFVLEPSPTTLRTANLRHRYGHVDRLLFDYFDTMENACEACSALLTAIGRARRHHRTLRHLLLCLDDDPAAAAELAQHVRLDNPLSRRCLTGFHGVHARYGPLAARLAAACRRLQRLARLARLARGAAAVALIGACTAAVVAALVLAAHAVMGIGVAAAAAAGGPAASARWMVNAAEKFRERHYARARAQVDAAARGAYIVGRDLDTVSRMVRRAHDELEHGRDVARIAMQGHRERPLVQEVIKEVEEYKEELNEQLQELEEHVCLCLITINRSRRLVAHEMTRGMPPLET